MILRPILLSLLLATQVIFAADAPHIRLMPYLSGVTKPIAFVDDGSGRLFVVEQHGFIRLVSNGQVESQPFLDLTDRIYDRDNECGLLGLAFHPQFKTNGRFFVNYTTRQHGKLETVVAEFKAAPLSDRVDASTERVILRFDQPYANHNGGNLIFGADGMLYIGNGDGGLAADPHNNGQQLNTWLGKILRIDVNGKQPYAVPADNPFVNTPNALPEIWALGMRNPWRFSFDHQTHQLYCGDVGQDIWEEVDIIEKGKNYGWSAREGMHDFKPERGVGTLTDPIKEYRHKDGDNCIIGGFVYRGRSMPDLQGVYLYCDNGSGRIWGLKWDGHALTLDAELLHVPLHISSFGEDRDGELYVCDHIGGKIFRIAE